MQKVLITGGSGLVGKHLTARLIQSGYEVIHLSRNAKTSDAIKVYGWNVDKQELDEAVFDHTDHIIHLAGASVATYWTAAYKKELLNSRVKSAELLFNFLSKHKNQVKSFISASAVGYYQEKGNQWIQESAAAGTDYLARLCLQWEAAAKKFESLDKRVVVLRTGIVLANDGGTLPALLQPMKFGLSIIFGNGKQYYPWIHVEDLCRMYQLAVQNNEVQGIFNAVAPAPVPFRELLEALALAARKKTLNLPLPRWAGKLIPGEFGNSLYCSLRCSSEKIEAARFEFQHPALNEALHDLIQK